MDGRFGSPEYGREEFRAAIAAMLIGGELKTGPSDNIAAYTGNWAKMLKYKPFELARATNDAQKITGFLLKLGQQREQKQSTENNAGFKKDDEIAYLDSTYKVLETHGGAANSVAWLKNSPSAVS